MLKANVPIFIVCFATFYAKSSSFITPKGNRTYIQYKIKVKRTQTHIDTLSLLCGSCG